MTKQEVEQSIGKPLKVFKHINKNGQDVHVWEYTAPRELNPNGDDWQIRRIYFLEDNVIEISSGTWWD